MRDPGEPSSALTLSWLAGDPLLQGSLHEPQVCVGDRLGHGPGTSGPGSPSPPPPAALPSVPSHSEALWSLCDCTA